MMTIVTHVELKEGSGRSWDAAMRIRLSAAKKRPGWIGGQLLRPADKPERRMIVGTWRSRSDWGGGHHDPRFSGTRHQLDEIEGAPAEHAWHEVVLDVRKSPTALASASKQSTTRGPQVTAKKRPGR